MKTSIAALALLTVTAGAVYLSPHTGNTLQLTEDPVPVVAHSVAEKRRIQAVFVLDTTGSMSGLIDTAKEKIWSIASSMASAQPAPEIEIGLIAYRDRGDAYVTRITDLSADLDRVYATLMDFQADGGGDGPEDVNTALDHAINRISWSQNPDIYQVVFLVGDAPPHMDYQGQRRYPEILEDAGARGIIVNTIRCGSDPTTERQWQQIAALTQGRYFTVDQAGSAVAIVTPYDRELATLSAELDATRLVYGDELAKAKDELKRAATGKLHEFASTASRARRAAFNAMESGAKNLFGQDDLLSAVEAGEIDLEKMDETEMPVALQDLAPEAREEFVKELIGKRAALSQRIDALVDQRASYLAEESDKVADADASFEYQLYDTIRDQGSKVGLTYEAEKPQL